MSVEQVVDQVAGEREEYAGVLRFYELAKRQEWQVRDLPWNDLPPIPEGKGSPQRRARRSDMWRSVLTQQLQADMLACEMASQLLNVAPDPEAKLYYSTMVQDESRHTEAWLKLINDVGGIAERDPYLDELAHMTLEADTLEEKVFQMQVFYERLIISRFRLIARASRGTVLEELCNRLATDDGIHHGAGMAYERVLLEGAGKKMQADARGRGEPAAPDLRPARHVAAQGACGDRAPHVRARRAAASRGPRGRGQARPVARPRRQRRGTAQALSGSAADGRQGARRAHPRRDRPGGSGAGEIGLATVLVGDDPASDIYIRLKHKAAAEVGINAKDIRLASQTTEDELLRQVAELNADESIDGLLVQLPLPDHIDEARVIRAIDPVKDVDGLHPLNFGQLVLGSPAHVGATPVGVMRLLEEYDVPSKAPARSSSAAATSSASPQHCFCCTRTRPSPSAIRGHTTSARSRAKPTCSSSPSAGRAVIGPTTFARARR